MPAEQRGVAPPTGGWSVDGVVEHPRSSPPACREITAPHPILGVLDVCGWMGFIGAHEARHAGQIREIGAFVGA